LCAFFCFFVVLPFPLLVRCAHELPIVNLLVERRRVGLSFVQHAMADTKRQSIGAKATTQKTGPPGINELDAALSKAIGAKWVIKETLSPG